MRVVHDMLKSIEVPLERLRFVPDPLGLNVQQAECDCAACRLRRAIAAKLGVPLAAVSPLVPVVGGFPLLAAEAGGKQAAATDETQIATDEGEERKTAASSSSVFHPCPSVASPAASASGLSRAGQAIVAALNWLQGAFERVVLGRPKQSGSCRQRQRLVPKEDESR